MHCSNTEVTCNVLQLVKLSEYGELHITQAVFNRTFVSLKMLIIAMTVFGGILITIPKKYFKDQPMCYVGNDCSTYSLDQLHWCLHLKMDTQVWWRCYYSMEQM